MPESPPPPNRGPANDERALEALLSGEAYRFPEALIPVAGAIDALRAAPWRGELAGEDAARAVFRAAAAGSTPVPGPWAAGAEHGTVTARTLVLPPGNREQRSGARHRRRRRIGARAARWPLAAAVGAAGVVVIAVGVALAGVLPGSFTQTGNRTAGASTSSSSTAAPSITQRVEGVGNMEPTGTLGTSAAFGALHATQNPGDLCRAYYSFFEQAEPQSSFAAEAALRAKLNALVGNPARVFTYCVPYLGYFSVDKASGTSTAAPPEIYSGGVGATVSPSPSPNPAKGTSGAGQSTIGKPGISKPWPGSSGGQAGSGQG
jgi:hypothetical protein